MWDRGINRTKSITFLSYNQYSRDHNWYTYLNCGFYIYWTCILLVRNASSVVRLVETCNFGVWQKRTGKCALRLRRIQCKVSTFLHLRRRQRTSAYLLIQLVNVSSWGATGSRKVWRRTQSEILNITFSEAKNRRKLLSNRLTRHFKLTVNLVATFPKYHLPSQRTKFFYQSESSTPNCRFTTP